MNNELERFSLSSPPTPAPSPLRGEAARPPASVKMWRAALVVLVASSILISTSPGRADLPAPDNLLYGAIVLGSQPVTAAQTNVMVETRRTLAGPALSSYRMGSESDAGDFYVLKIVLEELAPTSGPASSLPGQSLYVVVRDASGPRATNTFLLAERGVVTRLDLGTGGNGDTDGDGLPDAWELARFGNLSRSASALAANGQTLLQNYVAGTDPANANDRFTLNITMGIPRQVVSFLARQASGPGYENRTRYYTLEYATNLNSGSWVGVPGRTNLVGHNAVVTHPTAEPGVQVYYRGQVRLQSP